MGVRPEAMAIEVGSRIELHLDMRKVHVFEPGGTGSNLAAPGES